MRTALTLFFTVVFLFARPAFAEFVVLSSTEKSIAVGAVIGDAQEISLPKNKTLMLIDQAGRTIKLNGPHKGKIEGKSGGTTDSTQVKALSSLIRDNEDDARSVGAIRKIDKKRIEDTIDSKEAAMVVNISETGDYCLLEGIAPKLVRYHSEKGKNAVLTAIANGASQPITWLENQVASSWPDKLQASDTARFLVTQEGKDTRTLLTLHQLEDNAPTVAHLAIALSGKECIEQARLMLVHMRRSAQ